MASGIYKLTFEDGSIYIGKSIDIERRWKEHSNKFIKCTAAKDLQHKFNCYGEPEFDVLHECHPDHIDLLESIYIDRYWDRLLNTTRSNLVPDEDKIYLLERGGILEYSTAAHLRHMEAQTEKVQSLTNKIEEILDKDKFVKKLIEEKETLDYENELNKQEIRRLKNRNWFERLFNM